MTDFETVTANLRKHGFAVSVFSAGEEAVRYLAEACRGKTVGLGGSTTAEQLKLYPALTDTAEKVYWHLLDMSAETMLSACEAPVYICGANAVAETGEVLNIDGRGNRLAGTLMKKETVYLLAGRNKLAPDLTAALERARHIAARKNCVRLNKNTPCAHSDHCFDCSAAERICNALLVLWRKPGWCERMEIVLIDEELGF